MSAGALNTEGAIDLAARVKDLEREVEETVPNLIDDQHAAALAFRRLTGATPPLQLLSRYERGFDRQIARTLRLLPQ